MKILLAGDYCPRNNVETLISQGKYEQVFGNVKDLIENYDISIVNFETVLTTGKEKPINKLGICLACDEKAIEALEYAGFKAVTMANNHIGDYGPSAILHTKQTCEQYGLKTVGAGKNKEDASKILYFNNGKESTAIINCCEREFNIAGPTTPGANALNPINVYYAIQEAKTKADYIVVIIHGGHEHFQLPSIRMVDTYRFFIDAGADAVVNHHQHCYSGYEVYKNHPIFYGLGNFCFEDHTNPPTWYEGYMVGLNLKKSGVEYILYPYIQCRESPTVELISDTASFTQHVKSINSIITDRKRLSEELSSYYETKSEYLKGMLEPYSGIVTGKLFSMGLLPKTVDERKLMFLRNKIDNDSHRDMFLYELRKHGDF